MVTSRFLGGGWVVGQVCSGKNKGEGVYDYAHQRCCSTTATKDLTHDPARVDDDCPVLGLRARQASAHLFGRRLFTSLQILLKVILLRLCGRQNQARKIVTLGTIQTQRHCLVHMHAVHLAPTASLTFPPDVLDQS